MPLPLAVVLASAAAPPPEAPLPDDTLSQLLAPGGALTLVLGAIWFSAREFRKGREMRVKEAEDAEEHARTAARTAEDERDRISGELRAKLTDVEQQLIELREEMRQTLSAQETRHRTEMRSQETRHRNEITEARAREEQANAENWRLRTLLTRRGYDPDTGEPIKASTKPEEHGAMDLTNDVPTARHDEDEEAVGP